MIWFGNLRKLVPAVATAAPRPNAPEQERMRFALEYVATYAPQLGGAALATELASTGWVDEKTAARLLPLFGHFDPDRHFADHLRKLSFRGRDSADEFRTAVRRVVEDLTGNAEVQPVGPETAIRFRRGEHEGIVLAHPEVHFSIGGPTREAVEQAIEEMPDSLVVIARNFNRDTAAHLSGLLSQTEVPGTLVTVNLLLGIRAITLRYQPEPERVVSLLGAGRPLRSVDVARLGDRAA